MNAIISTATCMNNLSRCIGFFVATSLASSALAWGPHPQITRAGIDALGKDDVLAFQLGSELLSLTNYCWLPDYKRLPFRASGEDFYADDYLLFPGVAKHFDHICPEV